MSMSSPKGSSASARLAEMPPRKLARITGLLWIATFITSIPALLLYAQVLNDKDFILGGGSNTPIFIGATLALLLIIANIGTAVLPYSLFKRYDDKLALGFVTARLTESGFIAVGILSVLAYMTLRDDPAGISDGTLVGLGQSLVAVEDATFLLGPGIVVGVGNGMILGWLMYRSGLLPRRLTYFGLVGGPLLCVSGIAVMFGAFDINSLPRFACALPEIIWELSIGIYLTFWGFKASAPILAERRETGLDQDLAIA